ncbi:hypothetical protein QBC36DRAFT_378170 [Triangularia setosa]|uniref:chitinase n=1 Tax=Triangularia setosa TaxID=2587417 RepID=A0AAN7A890_9PEZI|nr:hypothetical protein QBC36DRAFT_378170 [Podospora setosa]
MPRAGTNRASTAFSAAAVLLLLLCASPLLYSSSSVVNDNQRSRWQFWFRRDLIQDPPKDAAFIPIARRGPAHSNPLKLAPHEPLLFEEPTDTSTTELSPRSAGLSRRDGPLYCHNGPCVDGSCCGPDNVCGFGPDFCGEGCRFNCTATAMCGEHSQLGRMPCGMKLCCSASGWCGVSTQHISLLSLLERLLTGIIFAYLSLRRSTATTPTPYEARYPARPATVPVTSQACPRALMAVAAPAAVTSVTTSHGTSATGSATRIAAAHPDDPAMMREFTGLAKTGLKTWIAIGGFDFSDKGTPTHRTWSEMVATRDRRAAFISSVKDYMDVYGFTGVDIDWEYPGDPDRGGNKLADTQKLVLLMKEMRAAYGSNYGISLTLAPDYWYLRWFDAKAMEPYVDFFGFMAYDLHGPWDADVKALGSKVRGQADIREISENTKPLWFDGLNPAKLNFGLALYGRGYTLADPTCNQLLCPFSGGSNPAPCTNFQGVMSLHEIQQLIDRKGLTPQYLPDAMMKQITWDDQWIGYDDDETFAAKKAWADSRCFGGTMVWSIDFQVAGSGDSDDQKYGDVVYIGQEVFETPAAQCPAPCIMVFPSSSLPEPKVITMQPYTATLEVGTTTTTIMAVSTLSTTTVTVVNFFNHYITSGQQPGAVVTLRPSFQPAPVMLIVTGQDGQTTTRTVLPPPLGGGASSGGNDNGDDDDPPPTTPNFPEATGVIEPVEETHDPPPPGKTRLKCDTWFFNICINWPELDIKIGWWDIELPPVTATLTISTTSYGTTTTEGTVRTITSRTMSSEFPILGCALTDVTVSVSKTACASSRPTPRSINDDDGSPPASPLTPGADNDDCEDENEKADYVLVLDDPLSDMSEEQLGDNLDQAFDDYHLEKWSLIGLDDPLFNAFIYLFDVTKAYAKSLEGKFGVGSAHKISHPPSDSESPAPDLPSPGARRRRSTPRRNTNRNNETVGHPHLPSNPKIVRRMTIETPNYAMAHLSIPPAVYFDSDDRYSQPGDDHHTYFYRRHESECENQDVYIIESGYDIQHPHFSHLVASGRQKMLPRALTSWWEDRIQDDQSHATSVASMIAGKYTGVCSQGKVTLIGTSIRGKYWTGGGDAGALWGWMLVEALVKALGEIKRNGRGHRSVVNMSFTLGVTSPAMENMLSLLAQQFDKLNVVLVASSGNRFEHTDASLVPRRLLNHWPQAEMRVPSMIWVGASDMRGRRGIFSEAADIYAAGVDVKTSLVGSDIEDEFVADTGTSFAAPMVSGLVAYLRALEADVDYPNHALDSPANVKWFIQSHQRKVYSEHAKDNPGPGRYADGKPRTRWVKQVWNGQSETDEQCFFGEIPEVCKDYDMESDDEDHDNDHLEGDDGGGDNDCSGGDSDGDLDGSDGGSDFDGRWAKKRQTGGQCPVPGGPGIGGGDGGGVGGEGQLGPSKTFTYNTGTPSPTCTSGCGTLCTDFWCRPDRTGQPLHFTEPTRLSIITSASGGGEAIPTNCISSTITTTCHGDRQGQVCDPATVCVATSCAESSVCGPETLPPLPGPTSLICPEPWFSTTSAWCAGSGNKQACTTTTVCAVTPTVTPIYRYTTLDMCPGGMQCIRKTALVSCTGGNQARGLPEPTPTLDAAMELPAPLALSHDYEVEEEKRPLIVKHPRRPRTAPRLAVPVNHISEALASPVNNVLLQSRQLSEVCDVTVICAHCITPEPPEPEVPPVPDPCIKIRMTQIMTGANMHGLLYPGARKIWRMVFSFSQPGWMAFSAARTMKQCIHPRFAESMRSSDLGTALAACVSGGTLYSSTAHEGCLASKLPSLGACVGSR